MPIKLKFNAPKVEPLPAKHRIQFLGRTPKGEYVLVHGIGDDYGTYQVLKGKKDDLIPLEVTSRQRARDFYGTTYIRFNEPISNGYRNQELSFIPNSKKDGIMVTANKTVVNIERIV